MASSQANLREIAVEGFALIDKLYGPTRMSTANDGRREGFWVVHQVPNGEMENPALKTKAQNRWVIHSSMVELHDLPLYIYKARSSAASWGGLFS
ncbi:hypothetical protein CR513_62798, partial [Mucuna pruriens]